MALEEISRETLIEYPSSLESQFLKGSSLVLTKTYPVFDMDIIWLLSVLSKSIYSLMELATN